LHLSFEGHVGSHCLTLRGTMKISFLRKLHGLIPDSLVPSLLKPLRVNVLDPSTVSTCTYNYIWIVSSVLVLPSWSFKTDQPLERFFGIHPPFIPATLFALVASNASALVHATCRDAAYIRSHQETVNMQHINEERQSPTLERISGW